MVFHPAWRVASSHGVHDHSLDVIFLFSGWLHHLSCAGWREIFGLHWLARRGLLPDAGLARSSGIFDVAADDSHAHSGFSSPMGPAQADRPLDDPDLALRVCYRRAGLFNALPMVPSTGALAAIPSEDQSRHSFDMR